MNPLAKALKEAEEEAVIIGGGLGCDPLAEMDLMIRNGSYFAENCKKALKELAPALRKLKKLGMEIDVAATADDEQAGL